MGSTQKGWQRTGNERMGMMGNERVGMERMGNERIVDESKKMPPTKGWPMRTADERIADDYADDIDLMDRDPKNLNTDVVKIDFVDVIAEPEGIHSVGIFWKASFITFTFTKSCTYRFCTTIFGIPLAGLWGMIFALFSLFHIWFIEPVLKFMLIPVQWMGRIFAIFINLFCVPIFEAVGKSCSNIRVQNVSS